MNESKLVAIRKGMVYLGLTAMFVAATLFYFWGGSEAARAWYEGGVLFLVVSAILWVVIQKREVPTTE